MQGVGRGPQGVRGRVRGNSTVKHLFFPFGSVVSSGCPWFLLALIE